MPMRIVLTLVPKTTSPGLANLSDEPGPQGPWVWYAGISQGSHGPCGPGSSENYFAPTSSPTSPTRFFILHSVANSLQSRNLAKCPNRCSPRRR